mgnify:CR=1 FL=1
MAPAANRPAVRRAGRPRKFAAPSRPITVTLPEPTLEQLRTIHADRGQAIVTAANLAAPAAAGDAKLVELVRVAPGQALIVIPPSRMLRTVAWLRLAEVAPARFLLTTAPDVPPERVEITLGDLITEARRTAPGEVALLQTLRDTLSELRRSHRLSMSQILVAKVS